jgi:DNA-binding XRE family transcriptional regulator
MKISILIVFVTVLLNLSLSNNICATDTDDCPLRYIITADVAHGAPLELSYKTYDYLDAQELKVLKLVSNELRSNVCDYCDMYYEKNIHSPSKKKNHLYFDPIINLNPKSFFAKLRNNHKDASQFSLGERIKISRELFKESEKNKYKPWYKLCITQHLLENHYFSNDHDLIDSLKTLKEDMNYVLFKDFANTYTTDPMVPYHVVIYYQELMKEENKPKLEEIFSKHTDSHLLVYTSAPKFVVSKNDIPGAVRKLTFVNPKGKIHETEWGCAFNSKGLEFLGSPFYIKNISACFASECSVKTMVISDHVEKIGDNFGSGCRHLEYLVIGDSVESINSPFLPDCPSLSKISCLDIEQVELVKSVLCPEELERITFVTRS